VAAVELSMGAMPIMIMYCQRMRMNGGPCAKASAHDALLQFRVSKFPADELVGLEEKAQHQSPFG